jgi:hypothetical protein
MLQLSFCELFSQKSSDVLECGSIAPIVCDRAPGNISRRNDGNIRPNDLLLYHDCVHAVGRIYRMDVRVGSRDQFLCESGRGGIVDASTDCVHMRRVHWVI